MKVVAVEPIGISRERAENCYNTLKKEGRNVFLAECVGKTIE